MATNMTEAKLRRVLNALSEEAEDEDATRVDGIRVEWGEAAPGERPDGMTWSVPDADAGDPNRGSGEKREAVLQYDLWSAQRDVLDRLREGDVDVVAFLAGYGTGKSMLGARWLLAQATQYPGSKFLAMGVTFSEARDTTYSKLFQQLPGERTATTTSDYNGPENSPLVDDYNRQERRLTLANDSIIVLGSADKYNRFAGAEFGGVWLDEPSHYGETLHDLLGMLTTRLRGVAGPKKQVWTLTGEGYNAAWEILEKREGPDGNPIGLNIHVKRASVLDNPYLTEGEKEAFIRQYGGGPDEQQALHGGFSAAKGLVYSNFARETHVLPEKGANKRTDDEWRIYGYDAGWADPRVLLEIGKTSYDQLVVLDEFYQSESHVTDTIKWLKRNGKPKGTIYCEHEPSDIEEFKNAGFRAKKADKSIEAGIADVRKRLSAEGNAVVREQQRPTIVSTWTDGRGGVRDLGAEVYDDPPEGEEEREDRVGLFISSRAEHTVREFLSYKEEHVGTSQATDHCLDALRYAIHTTEGNGGRQDFTRDPDNRERPSTSITW